MTMTPASSSLSLPRDDLIDLLVRSAVRGYGCSGETAFDDEEDHLREFCGKSELSPEDFEWIVEWKQGRGFGRKVRQLSSETDIRGVTRMAFSIDNVATAIDTLVNSGGSGLKGVQYPTASAILTFHDQEKFTVIDPRAWNALDAIMSVGSRRGTDTGESYAAYVALCQTIARMFRLSLRDLDRGLYMLGGTPWVLELLKTRRQTSHG